MPCIWRRARSGTSSDSTKSFRSSPNPPRGSENLSAVVIRKNRSSRARESGGISLRTLRSYRRGGRGERGRQRGTAAPVLLVVLVLERQDGEAVAAEETLLEGECLRRQTREPDAREHEDRGWHRQVEEVAQRRDHEDRDERAEHREHERATPPDERPGEAREDHEPDAHEHDRGGRARLLEGDA